MYAVTGIRALSSEVRSSVSAFEIGAWYEMSRLAASMGDSVSATDDRLVAGAVELDLGARGGLVPGEGAAHHARHLELTAHDPDVAPRRAARAEDRGELVVDRCEERRAGVAHQGDHSVGS